MAVRGGGGGSGGEVARPCATCPGSAGRPGRGQEAAAQQPPPCATGWQRQPPCHDAATVICQQQAVLAPTAPLRGAQGVYGRPARAPPALPCPAHCLCHQLWPARVPDHKAALISACIHWPVLIRVQRSAEHSGRATTLAGAGEDLRSAVPSAAVKKVHGGAPANKWGEKKGGRVGVRGRRRGVQEGATARRSAGPRTPQPLLCRWRTSTRTQHGTAAHWQGPHRGPACQRPG